MAIGNGLGPSGHEGSFDHVIADNLEGRRAKRGVWRRRIQAKFVGAVKKTVKKTGRLRACRIWLEILYKQSTRYVRHDTPSICIESPHSEISRVTRQLKTGK